MEGFNVVKECSLPVHHIDDLMRLERDLGPSYRYEGYVIGIKKVMAEGPCPPTLSLESFKKVKDDFLVSISSTPDGSGILSERQILACDIVKNSIKIGSRLSFLQKRGCRIPEGLYLAVI
jgi:hypothetical protein